MTTVACITITTVQCCQCHVHFGMDEGLYKELRESHDTFYCPLGHRQHFSGKSEKEKLRAEKQRLEAQVARERTWRQQAEERTAAERRRTSAAKGQLTKAKKRAAHGVCPCCSRTFANVQKHIDGQHPEYAEMNK